MRPANRYSPCGTILGDQRCAGIGFLAGADEGDGGKLISCRGVSKSFGERAVLADVSFEVQPGELCALLGPNGAGKSTLLKILTGLLAPDQGEAVVGGLPVAGSPPQLRRKIGVVPENLALFPELTIEEHLAMSGPIYGLDKHT